MPTSTRRGLILQAVAVGLLVLLVGLMAVVLIKVARSQESGEATRELLVECIVAPDKREPPVRDPKPGDCYLSQQSRQGDLLGEPQAPINTVSVAAAACAVANDGDQAATLRCTLAAVARR